MIIQTTFRAPSKNQYPHNSPTIVLYIRGDHGGSRCEILQLQWYVCRSQLLAIGCVRLVDSRLESRHKVNVILLTQQIHGRVLGSRRLKIGVSYIKSWCQSLTMNRDTILSQILFISKYFCTITVLILHLYGRNRSDGRKRRLLAPPIDLKQGKIAGNSV